MFAPRLLFPLRWGVALIGALALSGMWFADGRASAQPPDTTPPGTTPSDAAESTEAAEEPAGEEPVRGDEASVPGAGVPEAGVPEAPNGNRGAATAGASPYAPVEDPEEGIGVPTTVCTGRRIARINVEGNRRVSEDDILATIRLRPGRTCRDRDVAEDARALWDQGFYDDIQVDAERESRNRVALTFRIRERPAIGRVAFEGNDNIGDEDLVEEVNLEEGGVLSLTRVREQVTKVRDKYAEEGFFLARVKTRLRNLPKNQVEVAFVIEEGERVTVRRVRFIGNRSIPDDELSGIMRTKATGFFSFLSNDDRFDRNNFEEDTTRIQAYYYDKGFLTMRLGTPRIELSDDRRFIDVSVPIVEGPRFRIGRLMVQELDEDGDPIEPLGGRRAVRDLVQSNPGDWFNRTSIAKSLQAITRRYRDEGFAQVNINPGTDLDMDRRVVHITVMIRRGPPVRVERIQVRGNTKTRDSVIRREMVINEGDLYSQSLVEQSRGHVQRLGYFERVEFSEQEGSAPDRIVITIEVSERATGTFQVGAGFSSVDAFILTGQVQQQNLFGNGQSLSLQLQISGIRQNGQIQFVEPYFFNTQWSLGVELFRIVRQFSFFTRESTGGGFTLGHPILDNRFRVFLKYRADYVQIGAATGSLFGASNFGAQGLQLFQQLPFDNLFRAGFTSSLRLTATFDARDNRLFPSDGFYASWSTEVADEVLASENTFTRHDLELRGYVPLFEGIVFRARGAAGLITSRIANGVPVYERYRLGGIFNVRGFRLNSLGPRLGVTSTIDPNGTVFPGGIEIGGNAQFFYNVELEFPIIKEVNIRGVIFTDGGNVWNLDDPFCSAAAADGGVDATDACRFNPFDIRASWGFGVRWVSPLGPLRFEWGIPFMRIPALNENDIDFQFTIGNFF